MEWVQELGSVLGSVWAMALGMASGMEWVQELGSVWAMT